MFVDTHTHFYDQWLFPDAEAAIKRALEAGVGKMIQADVDSSERSAMWEIGNRYPGVIYEMLGLYPCSVHPESWQYELDQVYSISVKGYFESAQISTNGPGPITDAGPGPGSMPQSGLKANSGGPGPGDKSGPGPLGIADGLTDGTSPSLTGTKVDQVQFQVPDLVQHMCHREVLNPNVVDQVQSTKVDLVHHTPIVAIGEIGLDYHEGKEFAGLQKEVLRLQFELAAKLDLPVNIHLRDAWEDFFEVVEDCRHLHLRGNLHCFTASYEVYERANKYADFSVGIGGVITFKNAGLPKVLERIPMEKILLETDAPYIAPVPYRGRRNESSYLPIIAAKVAEVKGLAIEQIEEITTNNALKLFDRI